MNVAIVGSRDFHSAELVREFVKRLAKKYPHAVVISGGARGVDSWAADTAAKLGLGTVEFCVVKGRVVEHPEREQLFTHMLRTNVQAKLRLDKETLERFEGWCDGEYGALSPRCGAFANAAFARNDWIVKAADVVVAFWDGKSSGTRSTIRAAEKLNRPVFINPLEGA